jgi:hypothetical protein
MFLASVRSIYVSPKIEALGASLLFVSGALVVCAMLSGTASAQQGMGQENHGNVQRARRDTGHQRPGFTTGTYVFVSPENTTVMESGSYRELTLITCYPFYFAGSAPKRFIVHALPM